MSFFEAMDDRETSSASEKLPDLPELADKEKLRMEKEVLGMYLSAHPMEEFKQQLAQYCTHQSSQLKSLKDRTEVVVGGVISSIKCANTRNPKPGSPSRYANFDLEDLEGPVRCICWPNAYQEYEFQIQPEAIVIMRATVDKRGSEDDVNLLVNEVIPIAEADQRFTAGLRIQLDAQRHTPAAVVSLNEILRGYPGAMEVSVWLTLEDGAIVQMTVNRHKVAVTPELRGRLDDLLGSDGHRLLVAPPKSKAAGGNGNSRSYAQSFRKPG